MQLTHSFTVPAPVDEAWKVLRDIERIAPCMPGASIDEVNGDRFTGRVKVKVGPIQVTYKGEAAFVDVDEDQHVATIEASGKEARGSGTASATVRAALTSAGDSTDVEMTTDLAITGKPAQFGRGVMADVGGKLVQRFADCLAEQLAGEPAASVATGTAAAANGEARTTGAGESDAPTASRSAHPYAGEPEQVVRTAETHPGSVRPSSPVEPEPIDLFDIAGAPIAKRLAPAAAAALILALLIWLIRRR